MGKIQVEVGCAPDFPLWLCPGEAPGSEQLGGGQSPGVDFNFKKINVLTQNNCRSICGAEYEGVQSKFSPGSGAHSSWGSVDSALVLRVHSGFERI